jgi:hypothetical protein
MTSFLEGAAGSTHVWRLEGISPAHLADDAERRILNALRYSVDQARPLSVRDIGGIRREVTVTVRDFDERAEEEAVSYYCRKRLGAGVGERTAAIFRAARAELAPYCGETRRTWISALHVGQVAIVGVPAELFTVLGIQLKQRSPFRHTIVAELANDYVGYAANADAYRLGGYQLWTGRHSWTARRTGELLVDRTLTLLDELYASV